MYAGLAGPGWGGRCSAGGLQCMLNRRVRELSDAANKMGLSANELLRREGPRDCGSRGGRCMQAGGTGEGSKCGAERRGRGVGWGGGPARRQGMKVRKRRPRREAAGGSKQAGTPIGIRTGTAPKTEKTKRPGEDQEGERGTAGGENGGRGGSARGCDRRPGQRRRRSAGRGRGTGAGHGLGRWGAVTTGEMRLDAAAERRGWVRRATWE